VIAQPNSVSASSGDGTLYRRLVRLMRPHRTLLAVLLALDLLGSLWVLLTPVPLKIAIDSVIGARPLPDFVAAVLPEAITTSATILLVVAAGLVLAIALLSNIQSLGTALLRSCIGERLVLDLRGRLFEHAQQLSPSYHDAEGSVDAVYRIQKDAAAVEDIVVDGALPLVSAALTVALMFTVTLWLDWELGLVAGAVAPVLLYISSRYKPRLRQQAREVRELESNALAVVHEVLAALRVVQAFGQEAHEQERFLRQCRAGVRARLWLVLGTGCYGVAIRLTVALGTAAVLFIGVSHVQSGVITLGELLLVLAYLAQMYEPLKTISRKAGGMQAHLASAERAFALLDQRAEVVTPPHARPIVRTRGAVHLRNVTFGYDEGRPVLRNTSLDIAPATRVGIVGATGAGKTTLFNLMMRFYDPIDGQVLLDGVDLRDCCLADLRRQFALVHQDAVLFSASVAENIAYARPDAGRTEIETAARAAHAHDFISRLPDGYETRVGERGMRLSGGERQRISIARAFLKDAPILLLDEPTSAVDVQTEAGILEAMEHLMRGRTSIIITHRPTPLTACDTVFHLENGQLAAVLRKCDHGVV
jgi:ATP-binding cassette, subfamily B, bacterial